MPHLSLVFTHDNPNFAEFDRSTDPATIAIAGQPLSRHEERLRVGARVFSACEHAAVFMRCGAELDEVRMTCLRVANRRQSLIFGSLTATTTSSIGRSDTTRRRDRDRRLEPCGNPAHWKGHLDNELTARNMVKNPKHRPALPYVEIGGFMQELRQREGVAARALEFGVLTAVRPGNVPAATWDEIDLTAKIWAIDGSKMKAGKDHQVPLCDEAVALLKALPREEGNPLVFVGTAKSGGLSVNALNNLSKAVRVRTH